MIGAVDWATIAGWIVTVVSAGAAAYFGAYLRTRAERRAIEETLDKVERRAADINEAARVRWSKRSEICATLYGRLIMAKREFRNYLSSCTTSTDDAVEQLRASAKAFDDHFAENALFLPKEIKEQVQAIADQFAKVFNVNTLLRPAKAELESTDHEPAGQAEIRTTHYKLKSKALERFQDDGDLSKMISEVEDKLRSALELE